MTNVLKKVLLTLFTYLFLFSCQSDTKSTTEVEVYLRYLATTKELQVESSFFNRKDKTLQALSFDNVTLSNHIMKKRQLSTNQIRYQLNLDHHEAAEEYFLRFYDKGDYPQEVIIQPILVDSFYFENPIQKSEGASFTYLGAPMEATEKLTLIFSNEKNETSKVDIPQMPIGRAIKIRTEAVQSLPSGENEVYLVRTKVIPIESEAVKGKAILEYYSKTAKLSIVE